MSETPDARAWWRCFEPVHAVTYFAPECDDRLRAVGMRGFWMGYFAGRAAPMGAVGPAAVGALFFNFHDAMVRRSLPDAWGFAAPATVERARRTGAAAALRRLDPSLEDSAGPLVPLLQRAVEGAAGSGRALFAATRDLGWPEDPVEALWHGCTCLREQRGDGHVAALTTAGLDGCEALVLFAASEGIPAELFLKSRGWSAEDWAAARRRLEERSLFDGNGISPAGEGLRQSVERLTDELAQAPIASLGADDSGVLFAGLRTVSEAIAESGLIPFPNPIGLPEPGLRPEP
ncbi:MAG TPA: hypothetical protein VII19_00025 [Acidimicrobiales bacterium]